MVAQTTHAAGESARLAAELPSDTHAVVVTVPDEAALLELGLRLASAGIAHVIVREPDSPFFGAATAIGICPQNRQPLRRILSGLPLVR